MASNYTFTKKLRAAIKAKIHELGTDADDELPDYVMVLAANRKGKAQMKNDLQLFLGKNTAAFVDWLFDAFERIQKGGNESSTETGLKNQSSKVLNQPQPQKAHPPPLVNAIGRIVGTGRQASSVPIASSSDAPRSPRRQHYSPHRHGNNNSSLIKPKKDTSHSSHVRQKPVEAKPHRSPIKYDISASRARQDSYDRKRERSHNEERTSSKTESGRVKKHHKHKKERKHKKHKRRDSYDDGSDIIVYSKDRPESSEREISQPSPKIEVKSNRPQTPRDPEMYSAESKVGSYLFKKAFSASTESIELSAQTRSTVTKAASKSGLTVRIGKQSAHRIVVSDPPDPVGASQETSSRALNANVRKRRADDPARAVARLMGMGDIGITKVPKKVKEAASLNSPDDGDVQIVGEVSARITRKRDEALSPAPLSSKWDGQITIHDDSEEDTDNGEAEIDALLNEHQQLSKQIPPTSSLTRAEYMQQAAISEFTTPLNAVVRGDRCRFWPDCQRQAQGCPFIHPSSMCPLFPSCPYGNKCLYIHPMCKFNLRCTKMNCAYTHGKSPITLLPQNLTPVQAIQTSSVVATTNLLQSPSKLPAVISEANHAASKNIPKSSIPCRFKGRCPNEGCPYLHPPQCRFGLCCKKPLCQFSHRRPDLTKFKWVSSSKT